MMNESLKNAQKHLRIQTVNLKESRIFTRDSIEISNLDRDKCNAQSFRFADKVKETSLVDADKKEIWNYRFNYSVGTRLILSDEDIVSKEEGYEPVIEITATFEAKYLSLKQLKDEEFKAFATDNVGYHVWPYWREYIQSSCSRTGFIPALEVPVYVISKK